MKKSELSAHPALLCSCLFFRVILVSHTIYHWQWCLPQIRNHFWLFPKVPQQLFVFLSVRLSVRPAQSWHSVPASLNHCTISGDTALLNFASSDTRRTITRRFTCNKSSDIVHLQWYVGIRLCDAHMPSLCPPEIFHAFQNSSLSIALRQRVLSESYFLLHWMYSQGSLQELILNISSNFVSITTLL